MQANAIVRDTGWGIGAIQYQLDRTVEMLGDQVIQLTNVYPGESYARRVVISKVQPKRWPAQIQVMLNWNGDSYPFTFHVAKLGTPAPIFKAITRQSDLIDFRKNVRQPVPAEPAQPQPVVAAVYQQAPAQPQSAQPSHGLIPESGVRCITCR